MEFRFDPFKNDRDNSSYPTAPEVLDKTANKFRDAAFSVQDSFCNLEREMRRAYAYLKECVKCSPLYPLISKSNKLCNDAERVMNLAGCIPGISVPCNVLRSTIGVGQMIAGVVISAFSELGKHLSSQNLEEEELVVKWKVISQVGLEHTIHGCLNALKGAAGALVGSYAFGIGALTLLLPNTLNGREFYPHFAYGTLSAK